LRTMHELARRYTQLDQHGVHLADFIALERREDQDESVAAQKLRDGANPLLRYSRGATGQVATLEETRFLAVPDLTTAHSLESELGRCRIEQGDDRWACTLITLLGPISLTSLDAYDEAQLDYSPSDPTLHVLSPENLLARLRPSVRATIAFSPELRAMLQDEELVRLFGRAVGAGLIHGTETGGIVWENQGRKIDLSPRGQWHEALKQFALEMPRDARSALYGRQRRVTLQALKEAVDEPLTKTQERGLQRLVESLKDMDATSDPLERQMGWLLDWLNR